MNAGNSSKAFEADPGLYDLLINWPARLANEAPLFRRLFEEARVRRVLDVACGTGRHAEMFHSWGLQVEGADLSPEMISYCRTRLGEPENLRWVRRSFDEPCGRPGTFDAVVCLGNSLALAGDLETVHRAVHAMLASLRSGGICVIQVLNLWQLPDGPMIWQKCKRVTYGGMDRVLLKGVHRAGSRGFVDFVDLRLTGGEVESRFDTAVFLGLEASDLIATAGEAGAAQAQAYGTYRCEPYDRQTSPDLILVFRQG